MPQKYHWTNRWYTKTLLIGLVVSIAASNIVTAHTLASTSQATTTIQVSNPYRMDVEIEVKCDWDNTNQKFKFQKRFLFPSKSVTSIEIPRASIRCELWPRVNFL